MSLEPLLHLLSLCREVAKAHHALSQHRTSNTNASTGAGLRDQEDLLRTLANAQERLAQAAREAFPQTREVSE